MMENCQTLYEASITNIETRNSTQKENYRQTHLTDARIDAKILRSIIMLDAGILSKKTSGPSAMLCQKDHTS